MLDTNQIPIPVYYSAQDYRKEEPAFVVLLGQARAWRREDKAYFINCGNALRLTPEFEERLRGVLNEDGLPDLRALERDESLVMGEHVMNANADGEQWARLLVRSWNPRIALLQHAESLTRYQNLQKSGAAS